MNKHSALYIHHGFSLIEMLIVLAIISILALVAMPSKSGKINRVRIEQSLSLVDDYKASIEHFYKLQDEFPESHEDIGMPVPENIKGNFVSAVYMDGGALHIELGNKIPPQLAGSLLSVRPIFVPEVANTPVSWVCGNDSIPQGMVAAGDNRTSIALEHLPMLCR